MPRLNAHGVALLGRSGGPASVNGRIIIDPGGGPASWLNGDTILVNTNARAVWEVLAVSVKDPSVRILLQPGGANDLAAGGDRWLSWAAGYGLDGSLGHLAAAGLRGAGLDGTLAYCPDRQVGVGLVLAAPDGSEVNVPGAIVYDEYSLQVLGPSTALWYDGARVNTFGDIPPLVFAVPPGKTRLVHLPGEDWLVYWSESLQALVAHVNGATDGYRLQEGPFAFNHDAVAVDGELVVAWSLTQGEGPSDGVTVQVDRSRPRVPLVVAPEPPDPIPPDPEPEPPQPEPPGPDPEPEPPIIEPYYRAQEYR